MPKIKQLCEFLGVTRDEEFLNAVREACSFKKLKAGKDAQVGVQSFFREGKSMYRKGNSIHIRLVYSLHQILIKFPRMIVH